MKFILAIACCLSVSLAADVRCKTNDDCGVGECCIPENRFHILSRRAELKSIKPWCKYDILSCYCPRIICRVIVRSDIRGDD